jgi:hypothetical protein
MPSRSVVPDLPDDPEARANWAMRYRDRFPTLPTARRLCRAPSAHLSSSLELRPLFVSKRRLTGRRGRT